MKHPQPTNPGVEQATPAVVQNATTAPVPRPLTYEELMEALRNGTLELVEPGTVSTPSTRTLAKLSEANAQLAEESTQLMARNAALEENALHVQAELRRREEQLVEAGKDAEVVARECEALRAANTNLLEEVEELQKQNETTARDLATAYKDRDQLRAMNSRNAERMYEAEA
ncbi:MAG: hypothetical protein JST38_14420, partial [Bacteroidetes bacterium]|nr:hypothetical protein [Bacteroidota bacterium]